MARRGAGLVPLAVGLFVHALVRVDARRHGGEAREVVEMSRSLFSSAGNPFRATQQYNVARWTSSGMASENTIPEMKISAEEGQRRLLEKASLNYTHDDAEWDSIRVHVST